MFENVEPVDVAIAPTVEDFAERYVRCEHPVIVRGGAADWPPSSRWTPEYLKAACGARQVKTWVSTTGDWLNSGAEPQTTFAEAIDSIFAPANSEHKVQVAQQSLTGWAALDDDSRPLRYIGRPIVNKNIWIASAGNITKAHYDMNDNINIQILGRKCVILFPSEQLNELYPRSVWDYRSNFSRVDIENPDLDRYPLFSRATPFKVVLEPGDFIYIPIYWWHQFYTREASLNVNFWWRARAAQALRRHSLRYWPRMARDHSLPRHIIGTVLDMSESLVAR